MTTRTVDFSRYSSMRIGPAAQVNVIENDEEAVQNDAFLVGGAFNLLFAPKPPKLSMLGGSYDFIRLENGLLVVGAATVAARVASFAKKNDLGGLEFMAHLPGTVGGLLAMNAGVKQYETFSILRRIRFAHGWVEAQDVEHGYRFANLGGVALEAEFESSKGFSQSRLEELKAMRSNQPSDPSAGSCFKNPPNDFAGRLIEAVDLRGAREGGMAFSEKHANFLVNLGSGKFGDAKKLISTAQKRIFELFGLQMQLEIKIVGEE